MVINHLWSLMVSVLMASTQEDVHTGVGEGPGRA
jgi:hypothetical protein